MKLKYKHTITACFVGYIVQAIINNFMPLLFLTFEASYGIPLSKIGLLISINFGLQLLTDLAAAFVLDKTGWRVPVVLAHLLAASGLIMLAFLPDIMDDKFLALLISVAVFGVGGGLLEVLISPITEACPGEDKAGAMSLLHSFFCWGHVGVVLISTLFFALFGIENRRILTLFWAIIPLLNMIFFCFVPFGTLDNEKEEKSSLASLFKNKSFLLMLLLMFCAACSELSVSQWASAFAEKALKVDKAVGDLAGPMFFALLMGISRVLHSAYGQRLRLSLEKLILASSLLCVASYLLIALSPIPILSLIGCGICGFSVGILWPGTFSLGAKYIKGGTAMFAIMALFGDLGCGLGPLVVGNVASATNDNLSLGILVAVIFPIIMTIALLVHIFSKNLQ